MSKQAFPKPLEVTQFWKVREKKGLEPIPALINDILLISVYRPKKIYMYQTLLWTYGKPL